MATTQDIEWTRGQTEEWNLTILDSTGAADDLGDATALEFEVKRYEGAADPAALSLALGTGITITSAPAGACSLVATAAQTFALASGAWRYDVFVTRVGGARKRAMRGLLTVRDVVNFL